MFLHWPHLPLTENKENNVALGELPQRLQVLCHKTGKAITHQDLPRMPLHLGSCTHSNVTLFSPKNSSWNQSKHGLKWCKLRVWACFCPVAAYTAAHICVCELICAPRQVGWTFYFGHKNHSDTLSLSLSHAVTWPQLRWYSPALCHQAAISGTSVATCNLGWEHLCLVSLATERREMTALSTIWLSFHSYTHYLFLQIFGGPQLYGVEMQEETICWFTWNWALCSCIPSRVTMTTRDVNIQILFLVIFLVLIFHHRNTQSSEQVGAWHKIPFVIQMRDICSIWETLRGLQRSKTLGDFRRFDCTGQRMLLYWSQHHVTTIPCFHL